MKKWTCICLVTVMLFGMLSLPGFGVDSVKNLVPPDGTYETDIYVQDDLPPELQARIYAYFANGGVQEDLQRNILCDLFGHNYTTSTTTTVTHNVYTTSPKCVRNTYTTYTCSRCGHIETVLEKSERISTCHG